MAQRDRKQSAGSGPGNKVIATTFLESLAVRGRAATRERAVRSLDASAAGLTEAKRWLPDDALGRMFLASDAEPSLARSVGHRLIAPDAMGLALYRLGLGTPEKAYRRLQSWLPRESVASSWLAEAIGSGSARLRFQETGDEDGGPPGARSGAESGRARSALCALRIGMLEAVPTLYGLLPARVEQSTCVAQGADACRYEIAWQRGSSAGLVTGTLVGAGLAAGFGLLGHVLDASVLPLVASGSCGLASLLLGVAIGRAFDLHRQLEAVAGARRGHLALFDQVDDVLASKLDALARADAKLEGDEFAIRADRASGHSATSSLEGLPDRAEIVGAAQKIHMAAGDLECWFEAGAGSEIAAKADEIVRARGLVREIRGSAARIARAGESEDSTARHPIDLVGLVARAVAAARPALPRSVVIDVEHEDDLVPITCEPVQIEQVVIQLLRNAAEASRGLSDSPEILVSLRKVARGVELAVEDRGVGIDPSEIDEVFDPFFGERAAGIDEGFGLPVCLRIVERHGGELRIETEDRPGTRISVLLPESAEAGTA